MVWPFRVQWFSFHSDTKELHCHLTQHCHLRKNTGRDFVVRLALISVCNTLWNILSPFQHVCFSVALTSLLAHVKNGDK